MSLRPTLLAALLVAGGVCTAQAEPALTVGNTVSFFQGKFGTNNNINIRYDATDIQYGDSNWRVKLTLPYVSESGLPADSTLSGGTVVGGAGGSTQTRSASGLGDVWLDGHYKVFSGSGLTPSITPSRVRHQNADFAFLVKPLPCESTTYAHFCGSFVVATA